MTFPVGFIPASFHLAPCDAVGAPSGLIASPGSLGLGPPVLPSPTMRIHTYAKCDTCRKAVKWLKARRLDFEEIPIRERPPSQEELRRMLSLYRGEIKRLFNTAGGDYREMKLGAKLPSMGEDEALALLASNGNLVKRPFLLTDRGGLVGFKEPEWEEFFGTPEAD